MDLRLPLIKKFKETFTVPSRKNTAGNMLASSHFGQQIVPRLGCVLHPNLDEFGPARSAEVTGIARILGLTRNIRRAGIVDPYPFAEIIADKNP